MGRMLWSIQYKVDPDHFLDLELDRDSELELDLDSDLELDNVFIARARSLYRSDWVVVTRLYRGPMLCILMNFMLGLNLR